MTPTREQFAQWFAERYPDTTSVYSEFKGTTVRDLMREAHAAGLEQGLREAAQNALATLDGIADTNPRDTADFETPAEWITWAKSRARWAADALRAPVAQEIYAERVLKNMLQEADRRSAFDTLPDDYEAPH